MLTTAYAVCPYDCPSTCGFYAEIEDGRLKAVHPDPQHPVAPSGPCRKMARYERSVNAPDRTSQGSRMNEHIRSRGLLCPQPQSAQVLRTLLVSADLTAHEISATGGHGRFVPLYP